MPKGIAKNKEEKSRRMSISKKGQSHPQSIETRGKIRKSHIGFLNPMFGKQFTKEHKEKLSIGQKGAYKNGKRVPVRMVGEKHPMWKGGISADTMYRIRRKEKLAGRVRPEQCEVCGAFGAANRGLCFDHDHKTGKFRGWICGRCNSALGMVKDNTGILLGLVDYLNKSQST